VAIFFDTASTTRCCAEALELVAAYSGTHFGNPSSSHALGQQSAKAIREARVFFAEVFDVSPEQVVFTGSGTEADNLAISGVAFGPFGGKPQRVLVSSLEHPAVKKSATALSTFGIDAQTLPVTENGEIIPEEFLNLITRETSLISIHQVNNVVGSAYPVTELARTAKSRAPAVLFHTDAVQAFGKLPAPTGNSGVDLVSISSHKIEGPKGVGALILLNSQLTRSGQLGLRPLIWGGDQENGLRSGTQNAGLIAGFHVAARRSLNKMKEFISHTESLRSRLRSQLTTYGLLAPTPSRSLIRWNSPPGSVPYIVNLSIPGLSAGPFSRLLEERGCIVATGSACGSHSDDADPVLAALGLPADIQRAAIRISFSDMHSVADIDLLARTIEDSIAHMERLQGRKLRLRSRDGSESRK